jgi:hypothetical protein
MGEALLEALDIYLNESLNDDFAWNGGHKGSIPVSSLTFHSTDDRPRYCTGMISVAKLARLLSEIASR